MITVRYRRVSTITYVDIQLLEEDDIADVLQLLEDSPKVESYTLLDTKYMNLYTDDLLVYGLYPQAFTKFTSYSEF